MPTSSSDADETKSTNLNDKSKSAGTKSKSSHRTDHSPEQAEDPVATLDDELTEGKRLVEAAERYIFSIFSAKNLCIVIKIVLSAISVK